MKDLEHWLFSLLEEDERAWKVQDGVSVNDQHQPFDYQSVLFKGSERKNTGT